MYGVAKALEGLTPEDLDENLAVFEENRSALSDSEIRAFMTAWSRFDPEAAYAWSNRLQGYNRTKFAKIALWAWAAVDPQAAVEAFQSTPSGIREAGEIRLELVKGWVRGDDPEGVTDYILSLERERQNSMLLNKLARWVTAESGVDGAIAWAESIPEEGDGSWAKEIAFQSTMGAVAKLDPERAARWYESHRESGYAEAAIKSLAYSWVAAGDGAALFDWLQQQPEGQLRLETIRQAYRKWLETDPASATTWIRNVEFTPVLDPAAAIFARYESRVDAESAVEWAARIEDPTLQRRTIVPILRIWAKEDPDAARAWMVEHEYPESVKNDIIGKLSREAAALREQVETATEATTPATTQ